MSLYTESDVVIRTKLHTISLFPLVSREAVKGCVRKRGVCVRERGREIAKWDKGGVIATVGRSNVAYLFNI